MLYAVWAITNVSFVSAPLLGNSFAPLPGDSFRARYNAAWDAVLPWVGLHLFHLSAREIGTVAVWDSMAQNIQIFCEVALAFNGMVIWSILDRRRCHYRILHG